MRKRGRPPYRDMNAKLSYPDIVSSPGSISALWQAVLQQALKDRKRPTYTADAEEFWRVLGESRKLFNADNEDFKMICDMADLMPEQVLSLIRGV